MASVRVVIILLCTELFARGEVLEKHTKMIARPTSEQPNTPELLVVAADHGEATTALCSALGSHPCLVSVGEPFDATQQRWFSQDGENALVGLGGSPGKAPTYSKLQLKIDKAMQSRGQNHFNLSENLHKSHPNLHDFFMAVRSEVCGHVSLPSVCGSRCVLVHKMFPVYLSYNYTIVEDYIMSEDTMVLRTIRDEAEVIKSVNERFSHPMEQPEIDGLETWNSYLVQKESEVSGTKVWTNMSMDKKTFRSPKSFFEVLRPLFAQFGVPSDDATLQPVHDRIVNDFAAYAMKKKSHLRVSQ